MPEPERLARALADEMRFTASKDLLGLIESLALAARAPKHTPRAPRNPGLAPEYLLGRDVEWRALVERALEVADA